MFATRIQRVKAASAGSVNDIDQQGRGPLYYAILESRPDAMMYLLRDCDVLIPSLPNYDIDWVEPATLP